MVRGFAKNLIHKAETGDALRVEHAPLTHAGIYEQSQRQGEIGFAREVANRLRVPVLGQQEVILGEAALNVAVLAVDVGEHVDHLDFSGKGHVLPGTDEGARDEKSGSGDHKTPTGGHYQL